MMTIFGCHKLFNLQQAQVRLSSISISVINGQFSCSVCIAFAAFYISMIPLTQLITTTENIIGSSSKRPSKAVLGPLVIIPNYQQQV
jgi:hypothetical protein